MSYIPLDLPDLPVSNVVSMAAEPHLEQAHYLLAARFSNGNSQVHFATSAVIMTLLSIAATSVTRYFEPEKNKNPHPDGPTFKDCVLKFFPWDQVTIEDDQHRPAGERPSAAADELYRVFRNPLIHSGGMTAKPQLSGKIGDWHRGLKIVHVFPGHPSMEENEKAVAEYCTSSLSGDALIKLGALSSTVYTRPLYWCTRRMIEAFAKDVDVHNDIKARQNL